MALARRRGRGAVVILIQLPEHRWLFQGVLAASSDLGLFGEYLHTSGEAEAAGICAALSWALSLPVGLPFRIHTDCDWARCQAAGTWSQGAKQVQGSAFSLSRQLVLLHQALERDFALLPVRSHLGHPWNDLADSAARLVSTSGSQIVSPLARSWSSVLQSDVAPWLWLLPMSRWHAALPTVWSLAVEAPAPLPPAVRSCAHQFERILDLHHGRDVSARLSLQCSFASFNVTTLRPTAGDDATSQAATRIQGVQSLLQQQFHARQLTFVGLQETRVPASALYDSGPYVVLSASADEMGQGGVSLWVNSSLPYATDEQGQGLFFSRKNCVALHAEPRRLFVKVCAPGISALVCVWHAPHSMRPSEEREAWWHDSERLVRALIKPDDDLVLLVDANARVGSVVSSAVGPCGAERESHNGILFREFLQAWDLVLPATLPAHIGQHWTWTSPHGTHSRIDYVAVPAAWSPTITSSFVMQDVEHAQLRDNHFPVVACLHAVRHYACAFDKISGRCDPDPARAGLWAQSLDTCRPEPWTTSVDDHAYRTVTTHQRLMRKCSVPKSRQPRQPFLSVHTWQLVKFRQHLRRTVRALQAELRLQDLRCLFEVWRTSVSRHLVGLQSGGPAPSQACRRLACAVRALQLTAKEVRFSLRADKTGYLQHLAHRFRHAAETGDVQALYRALHCFRPNGGKRRRLHPLEGVCGSEGQPLHSQAEVARRWSEHFGAIEGGAPGQVSDLVAAYVADFDGRDDLPPLLQDLPSLQDWEASFAGLNSRKCPGPGGLSAAFVNMDRPALASQTFPLCLKTAHQGKEPLLWRGGRAFALYKGKGDARLCQSFRSILLSDMLAKRWHKLLRTAAMPGFEKDKGEGQFGVCGGATTSLLSLWVRACQNFLSNRSLSHGFLFTDVKNAFYTVVRQFLVGHPDPDLFVTWARSVGMSEDQLDLIASLLLDDVALFPAHISGFLRSRLQDTLSHTWFLTAGDDQPVLTSRGTRPGDPLADLMFAFVLKGILAECNSHIGQAGLTFQADTAGILPAVQPGTYVIEPSLSWHDDCAFVFVSSAPTTLRHAASETLHVVERAFCARGLALSFAPGKTELLLHPLRKGHQAVRQQLFTATAPAVCFLPEVGTMTQVRLVRGYTHLGSAIDVTGHVAHDIKRRLGCAREAARPLRKQVFGCAHVPLPTRTMLFRSLVLSRLLHNVGSWVCFTQTNRQAWQGGCISLYRQLLTGPDTTAFFHNHDLCRKLRLPPPAALLRFERLRLLALVASRGNSSLWRVLEAGIGDKGCWLTEAMADLCWLAELRPTPAATLLGSLELPQVFVHLQERPHLMRSLLRAAWPIAAVTCTEPDFERVVVRPQVQHACRLCGTFCTSRRGLHAHLAAKHLLRLRGRFFARGQVCQCCSKHFSHREKLIKHLVRGSPQCLNWLRRHVQPLTTEEESALSRSRPSARAGTGDLVRAYVGPAVCVDLADSELVEPYCIEDYL